MKSKLMAKKKWKTNKKNRPKKKMKTKKWQPRNLNQQTMRTTHNKAKSNNTKEMMKNMKKNKKKNKKNLKYSKMKHHLNHSWCITYLRKEFLKKKKKHHNYNWKMMSLKVKTPDKQTAPHQ